ncbi:MAG: response regulator [Oscillospiraceae bacterium]|nr:response regulator [Oscillospiraceae bacterium]
MEQAKKNNTTRFLWLSVIAVSLACIFVFGFLAIFMNRRSESAVNEVGAMYMSSMSEQVSMHFETMIQLRLAQVQFLTDTVKPEFIESDEELRAQLIRDGQAQSFTSLAYCGQSGEFEVLYGPEFQITDPEPFYRSMWEGDVKAAVGVTADGDNVILLGVGTGTYPMADGSLSAALVATIPVSYISDSLSLNENDQQMYAFIIREDGSFVVRSSDAYRDSYFERVRTLYDDVSGMTPDEYIQDLTAAMQRREDYSNEFTIDGQRRHLYCTRLAYSEWYLITFMPYNTLDSTINRLSQQWSLIAVGSCLLVLLLLVVLFALYFRMTRAQIRRLEEAQRTAEQARREAEHASHAKSEFLSNMSHDIRTPMNAIVGMTAIATANLDNPQQVQNCLRKITLSSRHLLGLINDVLDMSKIESGKMTLNYDQVSLREVMDSLVNIAQPQVRSKNQLFDVSIHDIITENVCCDGVRLNQVLLNLISNAIKFTPEGNEIHVALYQAESPRGEDFVRCHFWVADNGIGMSDEFQAHIFESFVREDSARVNRTEGSGLGMAITKYIVDAMAGQIEVESHQGAGSRFHVTLDLQKALVQEVDMVLPPWKMLVVDDDQTLCESVSESLKAIGVHAEWVLDGETAVRMVTEHNRRGDDYQIILLDWKLPGMDGIETAREIRHRLGENVPILLISAYDWSDIEKDAREAGVSGFIAKPLFRSTLFYGLRPFASDLPTDAPAKQEADGGFQGKRVLVAEDNELNWEIALELLSDLGLELEWAANGKICAEMYVASEPGYYAAVLMDLRMPVMNGYEAAQAIRSCGRFDADIPIIAMTADAFSEDIQHCLECGMNAHIAKPIDVQEVARILKKYIRE